GKKTQGTTVPAAGCWHRSGGRHGGSVRGFGEQRDHRGGEQGTEPRNGGSARGCQLPAALLCRELRAVCVRAEDAPAEEEEAGLQEEAEEGKAEAGCLRARGVNRQGCRRSARPEPAPYLHDCRRKKIHLLEPRCS
ncbi:SF1 binding protein candidate1, partial [Zea mays]